MTHLVANYPNPEGFQQALQAMFEANVDYLEIQLPFSNPLADGNLIYKANQQALEYHQTLSQILESINKPKGCTTQLILMGYTTVLMQNGFSEVCTQLNLAGFSGLIFPDLVFGSPEQKTLSKCAKENSLDVIPVVSPLTTTKRLEKIIPELKLGQIVYAMARLGRTGDQTELTKIQDYLDRLKVSLVNFEIAVGFGIREKWQVDLLNKQSITAVIGSEIIRIIDTSSQNNISIYQSVKTFLSSLDN